MPFRNGNGAPLLVDGKRILFSAHGNTIRALAKHLIDISDKDIVEVDIPNRIPLVYEFDTERRVKSHYYLDEKWSVLPEIDT
jgi:2,3-bisphosphoglycerate-dependent phosphoglycerate mutase